MRRAVFLALLVTLAVVSVRRCNHIREWTTGRDKPTEATLASAPKLALEDVQVLTALNGEYTKLVDAVMPSVVAITTLARVRVPQAMDPYDYFFGRRARTVERTRSGLGSGVIVTKEGHILTNFHVVEGMDEIRVQLNDGRIEPAELVGADPRVDLAVLRVKAGNITPLPFGDSDVIRVGQIVFAVGNPYGLQETVTQGIISAKGRALSDSGPELIQTDAAVNPGNSGGPLLNLQGEIIGINNAIYSQTGSWAGISFSIPAAVARRTLEQILQNRPPSQPYLGVVMMNINQTLAQDLGLESTRGVLVAEVIGGSPAEKAGLQNGDVILKVNGRNVNDSRELLRKLRDMEVGSAAELAIFREGKELTVKALIAEVPAEASSARTPQAPVPAQPSPNNPPQGRNRAPRGGAQVQPEAPQGDSQNVLAGIEVAEIPDNLRAALPQRVRGGVVIATLDPRAPSAQRLRVGDVIE
ncbi:MAG: PDZ domain-containing protein, partial [Verrucomicrobiaceae bacterium]